MLAFASMTAYKTILAMKIFFPPWLDGTLPYLVNWLRHDDERKSFFNRRRPRRSGASHSQREGIFVQSGRGRLRRADQSRIVELGQTRGAQAVRRQAGTPACQRTKRN